MKNVVKLTGINILQLEDQQLHTQISLHFGNPEIQNLVLIVCNLAVIFKELKYKV